MTAEIAIMNKSAVALAADSAVTIQHRSGHKIYNTANKLFALSNHVPVGIMIYGSAELMNVPWETIIRVYQVYAKGKKFDRLSDYAKHFIGFLNRRNPLFPQTEQDKNFKRTVNSYFRTIRQEIDEAVKREIAVNGSATDAKITQLADAIIETHFDSWIKAKSIEHFPKRHRSVLLKKYGSSILFSFDQVFEKLPMSPSAAKKLKSVALDCFCKNQVRRDHSGVVIAGFGEKEIFPSVLSYQIECVINNRLKYLQYEGKTDQVNFKNTASVVPFAQEDVVHTLVEGIDPHYQRKVHALLAMVLSQYRDEIIAKLNIGGAQKDAFSKALNAFGKKVQADFRAKLEEHQHKYHIGPLVAVVEVLPKDELAAMAESLVNLTSLKRKMSLGEETVGGPIDVAIISKGEGLIWIRRKHYFKKELNPHFFVRYGIAE